MARMGRPKDSHKRHRMHKTKPKVFLSCLSLLWPSFDPCHPLNPWLRFQVDSPVIAWFDAATSLPMPKAPSIPRPEYPRPQFVRAAWLIAMLLGGLLAVLLLYRWLAPRIRPA